MPCQTSRPELRAHRQHTDELCMEMQKAFQETAVKTSPRGTGTNKRNSKQLQKLRVEMKELRAEQYAEEEPESSEAEKFAEDVKALDKKISAQKRQDCEERDCHC